jgi:type II secretory pathway pseudopilin PulG
MSFFQKNHKRWIGVLTAGFTLLELLVATAVFMVIGGAVFAMFATNAPYFTRQQNLAGLNIALQNVVSQMQLDLVNAGTGYYPGSVISSWPIGVTVTNQSSSAGACNVAATFTYTANCFDTLNILTLNPNTPPTHPTDPSGGTTSANCSDLDTSPLYIQPNAGQTPTQTAANFHANDQVLLVTSSGGGSHSTITNFVSSTQASSGVQVNSFRLNGAPIIGANFVELPFNQVAPPASQTDPYLNDPLGISGPNSTNLGYYFCAQDWVMKLEPTTYSVDTTTNPQDPRLIRSQGGNQDIIAEQVIGFKVGAATWNPYISADYPTYSFYAQNALAASPSGYNNDYEQIRSVRVTLIGRTNPNPDPTYTFRNTFDGGPYQVQSATVVINPRNITMNGK